VLLYKKSKNCAKKKIKEAPNSPPLSLPTRKKSIKVPKIPHLSLPKKKVKKMFQKCAQTKKEKCKKRKAKIESHR
jgi:hypothetical protein